LIVIIASLISYHKPSRLNRICLSAVSRVVNQVNAETKSALKSLAAA